MSFKKQNVLIVGFLMLVGGGIAVHKIADCGPCLGKQDYVFAEKIKKHLRKTGDFVKISDIHPGNWVKVCAYGTGINANLKQVVASIQEAPLSEVTVLNDSFHYVTEKYDDSAILFIYEPARVEIFRMLPQKITYAGNDYQYGCRNQSDAYFLASRKREETDFGDYAMVRIVSREEM